MTLTMNIKIDSRKMRIFFDGDHEKKQKISEYLSSQGYSNIYKVMNEYDMNKKNIIENSNLHLSTIQGAIKIASIDSSSYFKNIDISSELLDTMQEAFEAKHKTLEENKNSLKYITGYFGKNYNLLFSSAAKKPIKLEFSFPISAHFNTSELNDKIMALLEPLNLPISEEDVDSVEKIIVSDVKEREYITVFPETEVNLSAAMEVVKLFEEMAKDITKNNKNNLPKDSVPSVVELTFRKFELAKQKEGLFALGASADISSSQSTELTSMRRPHAM